MGEILDENSSNLYYSNYNQNRDSNDSELKAKRMVMYQLDLKFLNFVIRLNDSNLEILDVGGGDGEFLNLIPGSHYKTYYDLDQQAKFRAQKKFPSIEYLTDLEKSGREFDLIIFRGTIQYQRNLMSTKNFVERFLKPGGRLVLLATPNIESPVASLAKDRWGLFVPYEHLYYFSIKNLEMLFDGLDLVHYDFPYIGTPYENLDTDLEKFKLLINGRLASPPPPFWGSMMNLVFKKP
jgi:SAM-dependent methyltransferase